MPATGMSRRAPLFAARDENARSENIMPGSEANCKKPLSAYLPKREDDAQSVGDENVCSSSVTSSSDDKKPPARGTPPAREETAKTGGPEPLREVLAERSCPRQRQLEPSLQAWAASRQKPSLARAGQNVGASERASTPPHRAAAAGHVGAGAQAPQARGPARPRGHLAALQAGQTDVWSQSLREGSESSRSASRGRAWQPRVTVPRGPYLRTASRSRSRSLTSSRSRTPDSTPVRRRAASEKRCLSERRTFSERRATSERRPLSEPRRCLLPLGEQAAIEHHLERMAAARNPSASPLRRRLDISSLPMVRTPAPPSPARSLVSDSHRPESSVESRLSQLSCPRVLSRPHPSSAEIQQRRAEEKREELRNLRMLNERTLREAIENPDRELDVPIRAPRSLLTVPRGPELSTARRGARSRSTSANRDEGCIPDCLELHQHMIPREQAAVESHLARAARAAAAASTHTPRANAPLLATPVPQQGAPAGQEDADLEEWLQQAPTLGERARRARALAEAESDKAAASEWARLCIFKPAAPEAALKDRAPPLAHERVVKTRQAVPPEQRAERARAEAQAKLEEEVAREAARLCVFKQSGSSAAGSASACDRRRGTRDSRTEEEEVASRGRQSWKFGADQ